MKILLLGDSITLGYQKYVKELLEGKCEVVYSDDNGRFVQYSYWLLNQFYKNEGHFDIVHFNNGYWDMNIESPMTTPLNSIEEYCFGLEKIVNFIKSQGSTPIFATTVPINEKGNSLDNTGVNGTINYDNSWVKEYNLAAKNLMKKLNVEVNDLYEDMLKGPLFYKCEDMLHLSEEGSKVCANKIKDIVLSKLNK